MAIVGYCSVRPGCDATQEEEHIAFPVLLVGALCANLPMHFGGGRWEMSQAILFAVVVAELVRFGAQIVYYRRGV